jgi:DNA-binding CsgD family transcriptional regulator
MEHSMVVVRSMARELLGCLYVSSPSCKQLEIATSFISDVIIEDKFFVDPRLRKNEAACLYWAAQGKSSAETASLLCLTKATVDTYRDRIKKKLGCKNMVQAVYEWGRFISTPADFAELSKDQYLSDYKG